MTTFINRTLSKIKNITRQRQLKNLKNIEALTFDPEKMVQRGVFGCLMLSAALWCSESAFASNSDIITSIDATSGTVMKFLKGSVFKISYFVGALVGTIAAFMSGGIARAITTVVIAIIGVVLMNTIFGVTFSE